MTNDPDRTAPVPDPQPGTPDPTEVLGAAAPPPPPPAPAAEPGTAAASAPATRWVWPSKRVGLLIAGLALVLACCVGLIGIAVGAAIVHHRGDDRGWHRPAFDDEEYGPGRPGHPGRDGGMTGPGGMGGPGWRSDDRGDWAPRWQRDGQAPPVGPGAQVPAPTQSATPAPSATS